MNNKCCHNGHTFSYCIPIVFNQAYVGYLIEQDRSEVVINLYCGLKTLLFRTKLKNDRKYEKRLHSFHFELWMVKNANISTFHIICQYRYSRSTQYSKIRITLFYEDFFLD